MRLTFFFSGLVGGQTAALLPSPALPREQFCSAPRNHLAKLARHLVELRSAKSLWVDALRFLLGVSPGLPLS